MYTVTTAYLTGWLLGALFGLWLGGTLLGKVKLFRDFWR